MKVRARSKRAASHRSREKAMRSIYSYALPVALLACLGCKPEAPAVVGRSGGPPVVGTNLAPLSDWSSELTSVDLFRASRTWLSGSADQFQDERSLDLDAAGWVR